MFHMKTKILSAVLSISMLLPLLVAPVMATEEGLSPLEGGYVTPSTESPVAEGGDSVGGQQTETHDGVDYTIHRTLTYLGDRKYALDVEVSTSMSTEHKTNSRSYANHGYEVIEEDGWYLLELWGGSGGDGENAPIVNDWGGAGGAGGYIGAKVYLKQGQVLAHSIGTNGGQSIQYDDGQGGVNGDGGTHGSSGAKTVGGGGGFSVFYVFDADEFDPEWITEEEVKIPDDARLANYVMIAGGGGGGGAHSLFSITGGGTIYDPDGGHGGYSESDYYISILGADYDVPGYVFPGSDGRSSGSSTAYVGRGGSTVPGTDVTTLLGLSGATTQPNDWTGLYAPSREYGAGGSGNLRGGGGGSGFCGGSGGIMDGILTATNVGGGGGGSSFVAKELNGQPIQFRFADDAPEKAYLSGWEKQPVGAETGGACTIMFLGLTDEKAVDMDCFKDVSVTTELSEYFEFVVDGYTLPDGATATYDAARSSVTVTGLNAMPTTHTSSGTVARCTLVFRAKDGFMGGNAIHAIASLEAMLPDPAGVQDYRVITATLSYALAYVNVPLLFTAHTKSFTSNQPAGYAYPVTSLYEDDYASLRDDLSADINYDGIEAISEYAVYDYGGSTPLTGNVAPETTTVYDVKYTVTLKHDPTEAPYDSVRTGPQIPVETVIAATASIGVAPAGDAFLNGLSVTATKALGYDGGVYDLTLGISQSSAPVEFPNVSYKSSTTGAGSYTVPETGWYYIQAWGGNGGDGGSADIKYTHPGYDGLFINIPAGTVVWFSDDIGGDTTKGGKGGAGAEVGNYFYLTEGTVINCDIGKAGNDVSTKQITYTSSANVNVVANGTGASGGDGTKVTIGGNTVLIAGGGGGGGGGVAAGRTDKLSKGFSNTYTYSLTSCNGKTSTTILSTEPSSAKGSSGSNANYSWKGTGVLSGHNGGVGSGGNGASSYINTSYGDTQSGHTITAAGKAIAAELKASRSGDSGQVSITLVETEDMVRTQESLSEMELEFAFARYFAFDRAKMVTPLGGTETRTTSGGVTTLTYTHSTYGTVAGCSYSTRTAADGYSTVLTVNGCTLAPDHTFSTVGSTRFCTYEATFQLVAYLTPADGFCGGNDVPVLAYGQVGKGGDSSTPPHEDKGIRVTQGADSYNLPAIDITDYANVATNFDPYAIFTTNDADIHLGDSIDSTGLYTFTPPTETWQTEFLSFSAPVAETFSPTRTTTYDLTATVAPTAAPQKTMIGVEATANEATRPATVYVEMPIIYNLEHLGHDGDAWVRDSATLSFQLKAEAGYLLPYAEENISIVNASGDPVDFVYDPESGAVTVSPAAVIGQLTVTAAARIRKYDIHIVYDLGTVNEIGEPNMVEYMYSQYLIDQGMSLDAPGEAVLAGDPLPTEWIDSIKAAAELAHAEKVGYDYVWSTDSPDEDGNIPANMPANDLWIYAGYEKQTFHVTVTYTYADGTLVTAEGFENPCVIEVAYEDAYSVQTPTLKGYLPDIDFVTGTMGLGDVSETVKYTAVPNILRVIYVDKNGRELARDADRTMTVGQSFSFAATEITGYTPTTPTISGVMDGDESRVIYVICTPNTYALHFVYQYTPSGTPYPEEKLAAVDFSAAVIDGGDERFVEYDNVYSYDPASGVTTGLPVPQIEGYAFVGWYADAALTTPVSETATVTFTGEITLYAKWKPQEFILTVQYIFNYVTGDFLPDGKTAEIIRSELVTYSALVEYGESYSVTPNSYVGYTPYTRFGLAEQAPALPTVSGEMPAANRLVTVTYAINIYTATFRDNGYYTVTYSDAATVDASVMEADTFATTWKAYQLKHGVNPTYLDAYTTPTQATKPTYTYEFTGWVSEDGSTAYPGKVHEDFPVVERDVTYYATYNAYENIVSVTFDGYSATYYPSVAAALTYAETAALAGKVTYKLRRNSGNGTALDLTGDTFVLGDAYLGSTALTVVIDLGGIHAAANDTPVVQHISNLLLTLTLTDSVTPCGSLTTTGTGDVCAVETAYGSVTINQPITIVAESSGGDATALSIQGLSGSATLTVSASAKISAYAPSGKATALELIKGTYSATLSDTSSATVTPEYRAEGKDAVGIAANGCSVSLYYGDVIADATETAYGITDAYTLYIYSTGSVTAKSDDFACGVQINDKSTTATVLSSSYCNIFAEGANTAIGIDIPVGGIMSNSNSSAVSDAYVGKVTSSNGVAYGIRNAGTVSALGTTFEVSAKGNAYGLYNVGGTVTASGVKTFFKVTATSETGIGVGIMSEGGSVGTAAAPLSNGIISGSTYGIYCEDGTVFASGNTLYFKGADAECAIGGNVVVTEGYVETDLNVPYEGYYRLAKYRTMVFVTNGGTEVATITQLYDTPLTVPGTTRVGYDFTNWCSDEGLATAYTIPSTMPDSDLVLYAKWTLLTYAYTLENERENMVVEFYKTATDTEPMERLVLDPSAANNTLPDSVKLENLAYYSGSFLYFPKGWFTGIVSGSTITYGDYVDLSGDLTKWDTDNDGVIKLYLRTQTISYSGSSITEKFQPMSVDANNPSKQEITNTYSGSSYAYYFYYVVPTSGSYKIHYANSSAGTSTSYRKYIYIARYAVGSTSATALKSDNYVVYNGSGSVTATCEAGDILIVRAYRYSSTATYKSTISTYITPPSGAENLPTYSVYAPLWAPSYAYDVEMGENGVVDLPMLDNMSNPGYKFVGWSEGAASDDAAAHILTLTPESIVQYGWTPNVRLDLYDNWEFKEMNADITEGGAYTEFTGEGISAVRDNGTVSLRFHTDATVNRALAFTFDSGLTEGTILTLVDLSVTPKAFYTYTVTADGLTSLNATDFAEMGVPDVFFGGSSSDLILQICYRNADVSATGEVVRLTYADSPISEADVPYAFIDADAKRVTGTEHSMTVADTDTLTVPVPALAGKGFAGEDKLVLFVDFGALEIGPGEVFNIGANTGVIYGKSLVRVDMGMTVADALSDTAVDLTYTMPTMRFREFDAAAVTYTVCVLPASDAETVSVLGDKLEPVLILDQTLTVTATPSVSADTSAVSVVGGETVRVALTYVEQSTPNGVIYPDVFVYAQTANGLNLLTESPFDELTADLGSGMLMKPDGGSAVTDQVFTATVSADAPAGLYFVEIRYIDKFIYVELLIS